VSGYLLDTHYWLWFQQANTNEISSDARNKLLDWQQKGILYISIISVWEIARLVADGQIDLGTSVDRFVEDAIRDGGLILLPITPQIVIESTRLPGTIHRDPMDRALVATTREQGLTLITRDRDIIKYALQNHVNARRP